MTLERISAFITYCIAVVLAWLGDLSIKDASTLGGLMIGVLMLAINWYYETKKYCYELQYGDETMDGDYERSIVRWEKGEEDTPAAPEVVAKVK